ncbi:MAG: hypothetical protein RLZ14_1761 [Actinomycetota bacterium]
MMLTDEERYRFDLQGFLVRRGALSAAEVDALHAEIDALSLPPPGESVQSQRFTGLLEAGGLLRDLMDHEAVIDVVRELCGPQVRLDHAYGIMMAPGTAGLGLHGGGVPFDPAQYYVFEGGRIHTGLIAVQWAVSHHGPGEGGFCCIPGSHKANFPKPGSIGSQHALVREVPLQAGDVVMFTEALTHGTLPWTAPHQRRSVLYKYSPGSSSWDRRPPCAPNAMASLTERQRRLCQPPSVAWHDPV